MADYNGVPGDVSLSPLFPAITSGATNSTEVMERLERLEKRVEELEQGRRLAQFHVSQFLRVNLPGYRQLLGVRPDWQPAHLVAALKHLENGTEPDDRQVAEAIKAKREGG